MWVGTAALFVLTGVVAGRVVEAEWRVTSPALAPGKGGVQPHNIDATPPLQVYPLHLSGDSTNRVNLVFFSDGCRSCRHCYLVSSKDLQPLVLRRKH